MEEFDDDDDADWGGGGRTPGVGIGIPNGLKRLGRNDWLTIPGGYNGGNGIPKSKYDFYFEMKISIYLD